MESRGCYIWRLVRVYLLSGIIYVFVSTLGGPLADDKFMVVCAAMFPFGVHFFNKIVPFNLFGNTNAVFIFWVMKIILSMLIGFIACPITTIYYIVKIIKG